MNNFRLLSFEYENFSDRIFYEFSPEISETYSLPYCTLLIGPNGTGKSRLLRALADAFNDLYLFYNDGISVERNELFVTKKEYTLSYTLNGRKYKFMKFGGSGLGYEIDDQPASHIEMILPKKLICISYNISDKFPVTFSSPLRTRKDRYHNDFYSYLGIKVQRNMATPRGHVYRTLDLLTSIIGNPNFTENARAIFDFLNLDPVIKLTYSVKLSEINNSLFYGDLNKAKFRDVVETYRRQNKLGYSESTFDKLLSDEGQMLEYFIHFLKDMGHRTGNRSIEFDFSGGHLVRSSGDIDYQLLDMARRLNIVSYRAVSLRRGSHEFSFDDSSSGQSHILTSMLSLACVIDENSLILIDEPETSLHPNWQMKYFDLINSVFDRLSSCHFLVASHSHFFSSDLRPNSSSIVSLTLDDDRKVESKLLPFETFGWSAEQILLTVFKAPTTRNYYVADRVGEILDLISKSKRDDKKIKTKVLELKRDNLLALSDEDPLKDVIAKLFKKYVTTQS